MSERIYLDNNATTFCDARVVEEMCKVLSSNMGNSSSVHAMGQEAKACLLEAQRTAGAVLDVSPNSLIFTSGGTEGINYCLRGLPRGHVVTSCVEHSAVDATLSVLEGQGVAVTRVAVGEVGAPHLDEIARAIRPETAFLVLIAANNETGVLSDLEPIAKLAAERGIPLVLDGVSWLGKEPIPKLPGKVFWCFSAHKIHGPTGVGIVVVPAGVKVEPLMTGGPQQQGRRGGTENVAGIVGFATALSVMQQDFESERERVRALRDRFESHICGSLDGIRVNGSGKRLGNTSNLAFDGVDGETLLYVLDREGIAASMGSACNSGAVEPSRVLMQMGYSRERVLSSLRFSLSRLTTQSEIDRASEIIVEQVIRFRAKQGLKS